MEKYGYLSKALNEHQNVEKNITSIRYPIGQFKAPDTITMIQIHDWIHAIEKLPTLLRTEVENFNERQMQTPYREGGWTVQQLVHHIADSHVNSFIR